ncbi:MULTISPECIES: hypothetical protein [Bacillaceae]|nr:MULTISPECIES: hypothetical protein [Bacillaceae]
MTNYIRCSLMHDRVMTGFIKPPLDLAEKQGFIMYIKEITLAIVLTTN